MREAKRFLDWMSMVQNHEIDVLATRLLSIEKQNRSLRFQLRLLGGIAVTLLAIFFTGASNPNGGILSRLDALEALFPRKGTETPLQKIEFTESGIVIRCGKANFWLKNDGALIRNFGMKEGKPRKQAAIIVSGDYWDVNSSLYQVLDRKKEDK